MCEPADHCDLTGNAASSTSEIRRLAFCIVRLDSLNVDPARVPPSRTETLCSSLSSLIGWNPLMKVVRALSSYRWYVKLRFYHFYPDVSQTVCVRRVIYCVRVVSTSGFRHLWKFSSILLFLSSEWVVQSVTGLWKGCFIGETTWDVLTHTLNLGYISELPIRNLHVRLYNSVG